MSLFTHKPTLGGDLVLLRPFEESDIAAMGPILADPVVLRLTGSVHTTAEMTAAAPVLDERVQRWYRTRIEQTDRLDLAVVDRRRDRCVGEVVLNHWSEPDDACNFRILLGPEGRDRGFGSEATRLVLDHAFAETTLNRIELEVYADNPRAIRVYERAGFRTEGRRRQAYRFDDRYIDALVMSVLRSDRSASPASRAAGSGLS